jgi:hypothetical protein
VGEPPKRSYLARSFTGEEAERSEAGEGSAIAFFSVIPSPSSTRGKLRLRSLGVILNEVKDPGSFSDSSRCSLKSAGASLRGARAGRPTRPYAGSLALTGRGRASSRSDL